MIEYEKYYKKGGSYLIPKEIFDELLEENQKYKEVIDKLIKELNDYLNINTVIRDELLDILKGVK